MSPQLHDFLIFVVNVFNDLIVLYFILGNGIYTGLMFISIGSVYLHQRKVGHAGLDAIRTSAATPPVTIIVPAFNEEDSILLTIESLMALDYPEKEVIVVDDGSTDETLQRLIERYGLRQMDLIYRPRLKASVPHAFFHNPDFPMLTVVAKPHGGKPDSLNVAVDVARSPYFCTVDADCIIERDALLRLMAPVIRSPINTVVSAGIVRVLNGCRVKGNEVVGIALPSGTLERFQVVEYLRSFLFGRPGWSMLGATFIAAGALCVFHRESAIDAGGFSSDTVTEDVDIVASIHRDKRTRKQKYRMVFSTDPVCWTLAPHTVGMLARQRRRWQLGLLQTLMKHDYMLFNPRYGTLGMLSMPFHTFIEGFGCVVEALGYVLVPISFMLGMTPLWLFLMFIFLAISYGALLSIGGVMLEEITYRRYPRMRDLVRLLLYAAIENVGYRQMIVLFRVQAFFKYLLGTRGWETVRHTVRVKRAEAEP
jgi:cellulose synthase/poly-beta-1,6-N-acetylglucosamine synthase-like glycosyltransferase